MTISHEQAEWFKATFDQLTDNMEKAVLGKRHVVRLALTCLVAGSLLLMVTIAYAAERWLERPFLGLLGRLRRRLRAIRIGRRDMRGAAG